MSEEPDENKATQPHGGNPNKSDEAQPDDRTHETAHASKARARCGCAVFCSAHSLLSPTANNCEDRTTCRLGHSRVRCPEVRFPRLEFDPTPLVPGGQSSTLAQEVRGIYCSFHLRCTIEQRRPRRTARQRQMHAAVYKYRLQLHAIEMDVI